MVVSLDLYEATGALGGLLFGIPKEPVRRLTAEIAHCQISSHLRLNVFGHEPVILAKLTDTLKALTLEH
jgi:hypothetical protein